MNTQNQNLVELLFENDELDLTKANVKDFVVKPSNLRVTRAFIEKWHYSRNVNGLRISQVFGLFHEKNLIGAMIYGALGMANNWKKFVEAESKVVELKRLCCIDKTPKNTESYFIGKTLRWMKQNSDYDLVVSYADTYYGHEGIIYKASNFKHMGLTTKGKVIDYNERYYHDKCIRTYYTNKDGEKVIKPFAQKIKGALETGEAKYVEMPEKHIYIYSLKG
jgi:hypothetical protein|tara:strand:+ start:588 stop:1250 length:663 start_codon:yes stop_codon:yes gene_type:complete